MSATQDQLIKQIRALFKAGKGTSRNQLQRILTILREPPSPTEPVFVPRGPGRPPKAQPQPQPQPQPQQPQFWPASPALMLVPPRYFSEPEPVQLKPLAEPAPHAPVLRCVISRIRPGKWIAVCAQLDITIEGESEYSLRELVKQRGQELLHSMDRATTREFMDKHGVEFPTYRGGFVLPEIEFVEVGR